MQATRGVLKARGWGREAEGDKLRFRASDWWVLGYDGG